MLKLAVIFLFWYALLLWWVREPGCFEDEVIVWDGDRHSVCVPLDDLVYGKGN